MSPESFRLLVGSIRDYAVFMLDTRGVILSWNAGAEQLKGYRADEIIGKSSRVFYTPEALAAGLPAKLLATAEADGRVENEGWRVRKDGTTFWADVVITALREADGRLVGFGKVTRDLTERRRAEEALRRSEERFRLMVESVKDYAIFMLDPDGRVATWNAGAERIKGYRPEEILGQHFSRFYEAEEIRAGKCERELAGAIRDGRFEDEGWRLRKDGSRFWANVVITALRDHDGVLVGFAKVTRDLTERRRLENERLQRAQAEEAVRLRDEFLSIASHELKTPLTAVQIQLDSLAQHLAPVDQRLTGKVERARRGVDRLSALIDALLDVARIATGSLTLVKVPLELGVLAAQVVDGMRDTASRAGCELRVLSDGPVVGQWDRVRIEQVLTNLISNALKYGARGPIDVRVALREGHAILEVADSGPGIPEKDAGRIFGRFERGVPMKNFGGLGLGLYVAREIAEAHGGTIGVSNRPKGGASFVVRLPLDSSAPAEGAAALSPGNVH